MGRCGALWGAVGWYAERYGALCCLWGVVCGYGALEVDVWGAVGHYGAL